MSIKRDIAEAHTQKVAVILRTPGLSSADKFQQIQDEFERAMERWIKVVRGYEKKQGGPQVASR